MKQVITIYLKTGGKVQYEIREDNMPPQVIKEMLMFTGWACEYRGQQTDEGEIRTLISQRAVSVAVNMDSIELYEIEIVQ
jgi:hypothetical protein